jgi:hypothetical protein
MWETCMGGGSGGWSKENGKKTIKKEKNRKMVERSVEHGVRVYLISNKRCLMISH